MIMNLKWPAKSFRKFALEKEDIFEISRNWDLATMVPRDLDMDIGLNKRIREHYQGLEERKKQEAAVGEVAYLIENLSFPTRDGGIAKSERYIFYGVAAEMVRDTWNIGDLFATLGKITTLLELHQRHKVVIILPTKVNMEYFKKLVECIFFGSEIEVKVAMEPKNGPKTKDRRKKEENADATTQRNRREEVVIVKPEEKKSFADTLRKIRDVVDMESTGAKVTAIRKTRNGEVLMRMKRQEGGGHADALKTAITDKMADVRVRTIKDREAIIHVMGLDSVTDAQELELALKEALGNPDASVKVTALWPAFGGCQNACHAP